MARTHLQRQLQAFDYGSPLSHIAGGSSYALGYFFDFDAHRISDADAEARQPRVAPRRPICHQTHSTQVITSASMPSLTATLLTSFRIVKLHTVEHISNSAPQRLVILA
jgi:hypothetical protein